MSGKMLMAMLAVMLFGRAGGIVAATATTTFQVDATVIGSCNVSATNLAFGNYDTLSATPTDAASTVTVQCSLSTSFDIGLDAGVGSGATVATRKMTQGADTLNYSLFQEAARTTVWGITVSTDTVADVGTGSGVAYPVYGRIPAGQIVNIGSYTDTVTVTVNF
jgi:spore coat protein U-like protein